MFKLMSSSIIFSSVVMGLMSIIVIAMLSSFISRVFISPPVDPTLDADIQRNTAQEVIQVSVLNAAGAQGIATKAKNYLRSRGFDVVEIGNFDKTVSKSCIIDCVGDLRSAMKVAYALGINDSLVVTKVDSNLFLRSSIILGMDYQELKPFN